MTKVTLFLEIAKDWKVPFEVVNDGEVTALAGSMEMNANSVLGISMGTSVAGGYVNPEGNITDWLNELAFVPVDYRADAPADEWSGDLGCGVQYFCQQGVARLAKAAGLNFLVFCGGTLWRMLRGNRTSREAVNFRRESRRIRYEQAQKLYNHKCAVCGRTDTDYPELEFRYCSRCAGYHCFCQDHINNHIHFTE